LVHAIDAGYMESILQRNKQLPLKPPVSTASVILATTNQIFSLGYYL